MIDILLTIVQKLERYHRRIVEGVVRCIPAERQTTGSVIAVYRHRITEDGDTIAEALVKVGDFCDRNSGSGCGNSRLCCDKLLYSVGLQQLSAGNVLCSHIAQHSGVAVVRLRRAAQVGVHIHQRELIRGIRNLWSIHNTPLHVLLQSHAQIVNEMGIHLIDDGLTLIRSNSKIANQVQH